MCLGKRNLGNCVISKWIDTCINGWMVEWMNESNTLLLYYTKIYLSNLFNST